MSLKKGKSVQYSDLALVYDDLMEHIDYELWAEYIHSLISPFTKEHNTVLEIAAGSGKFAAYISKYYQQYIISDLSFRMLMHNRNKRKERIVCDMRKLPFVNSSVNVIICLFDSVNYLLTQKGVLALFKEVNRALGNDGIFVFDCCLHNGSRKHTKYGKLQRKHKGIIYTQESTFNSRTDIHTNLFHILHPDGSVSTEKHRQKIYTLDTIFRKLDSAGFGVLECMKNFTYTEGTAESDRVHIVARKI